MNKGIEAGVAEVEIRKWGKENMVKKPLPIGVDDFEKLITKGYYYVDKTLMIKELLDKNGEVNLYTRPRRFGKSLNMSMLRYFFEDDRKGNGERIDHEQLFEGLNITGAGRAYTERMGKYPVIMLTLKSAKQPDFKSAYALLVREIADEFSRHSYVLADEQLAQQKERYVLLMSEKAEKSSYCDSLKFLSECLYKYHGKKAIILIDEYDVPLENAYLMGFYDDMVGFIRSLFESALKTNRSLEFAALTGCLRISKESIFTGMNNLKIYSILDKIYDEYFGFTEKDVKKLCDDYGLSHKFELIRDWYNGYIFGEANVYNPWSVVQYIFDLLADENEYPRAYWANTSSNSIVRKLIDRADGAAKEEIEQLIAGGTIVKPVHEDITYDEIYASMDNLWNFMFFTGYFRKEEEHIDRATNVRYLTLSIPNEEVRYIFREKVLGWFGEQVKARDRNRLFQAFVGREIDVLEEELSEMLMQTISFYDAQESFYHGFVTGVLGSMDGYIVRSNREGGSGRTDLFVKPLTRRKTAFIVEFKVADTFRELDRRMDDALAQIEERRYKKELEDDGYGDIVCYGIAFYRKDCRVKMGKFSSREKQKQNEYRTIN